MWVSDAYKKSIHGYREQAGVSNNHKYKIVKLCSSVNGNDSVAKSTNNAIEAEKNPLTRLGTLGRLSHNLTSSFECIITTVLGTFVARLGV